MAIHTPAKTTGPTQPVHVDKQPEAQKRRGSGSMGKVLGNRTFRLLWIGQGTSYIGDQFYLIAMPWLVLQLTGDPLALGMALAAAGVPRALLMLVGGAITDRFSPRKVMIVSDIGRLLLTALLAILVLTGNIQLWAIYLFALAFGAISGFFMPASSTIVPYIVDKEDLQAGNALIQGTAQLSAFIGPLLAGGIIALLSGQSGRAAGGYNSQEALGIALALAIDSFTFLVSVITLWMMGVLPRRNGEASAGRQEAGVLQSIKEGLSYAWGNHLMRILLGLIAVMNLLFAGPLVVGIPVLADMRLAEGAAAFGILMSAYAGGTLGGYLLAGALPPLKRVGVIVPLLISTFGLGLCALGLSNSTLVSFAVLLALGLGNGYMGITLITWVQKGTADAMLGRMMSLVLFANVGLIPLSQALAGALVGWNLTGLFLIAGALVLVVAALLPLSSEIRTTQL